MLVRLGNGEGWQFRALSAGGKAPISLEESVYLGAGEPTRRSEQIVVSGTVFRGEAKINWAWRRLSTRNAGHPKAEETALPELPELAPR